MNKPYLLFRNHNSPYWYAQIRLADGSLSNNKSTGKESRTEAEKVVMEWVVKGECPKRVSKKGNSKNSNSLDTLAILNQLKTKTFTDLEITQILDILKERNFIKTAVRTESKAARDAMEFLIEFWDYEKSPYIRELHLRGKSFHKKHSNRMTRIIFNYWEPIISGKLVGEITRDDINKIYDVESTQKLAPKTVKSIINAITVALKWAYLHGLTEINCYDGIIKPKDNPQKRAILTMEEIKLLFAAKWENETAKLACLIASYTGMRQGEIAALRLQDIGEDRIYIRHSWGKYDGLKTPKNGEEREIRIPHQLRDMIIMQAMKNPWRQDLSAFVFFSKSRDDRPMDTDTWSVYMRRALKSIGYPNPEKICFHSFRHSWCTTTLSEIGDQRICMIGSGHKTDKVFAHYANHIKKESALETIAKTSERLFAPIFEELSITDIEYCICDEAAAEAGNNRNLISFYLDEESKNERETTLA